MQNQAATGCSKFPKTFSREFCSTSSHETPSGTAESAVVKALPRSHECNVPPLCLCLRTLLYAVVGAPPFAEAPAFGSCAESKLKSFVIWI